MTQDQYQKIWQVLAVAFLITLVINHPLIAVVSVIVVGSYYKSHKIKNFFKGLWSKIAEKKDQKRNSYKITNSSVNQKTRTIKIED